MKKFTQTVMKISLFCLLIFIGQRSFGQIIFTSMPDSSALVGELYTYDVEVVASPDAATFSLDMKPAGMTINASTGLISWTPSNINQGGKVIVKAANSSATMYQTFFIYVSDAISCPSDLLSYWKLDDAMAAGDSTPDFSSGFAAYALSDMPNVAGQVEGGLDFATSTQFLRVPDRNQYEWERSSDFSFALWFNHSGDFLDYETFIARGDGDLGARIVLGIDQPSKKVVFLLRTGWQAADTSENDEVSFIAGNVVTNNQWHHLIAVYDGNTNNGTDITLKLYIDGVKYQTSRWLHNEYDYNMVNKDLTIGWFDVYQPGTTIPFRGKMDEVAIYNKAITDAEATELYNKGIAKKATCQAGNHAPVITSTPAIAVNEDSPYSYTLLGRDYEMTTLTKSAVVKPSWLSFDAATGLLSGTPANETVGDHPVTLRISDGLVDVDQVFTISVANINDPPVFTSVPATTADEGAVYVYLVEAEDLEGNTITYQAATIPAWLSFNTGTKVLAGTPANENVGTDSVVIRINDGFSDTYQRFQITINNAVNSAPEITSEPSDSVEVGETYSYQLVATDEDLGDELTFDVVNKPAWLIFQPSTGLLTGIPAESDLGTASITLTVTDGIETINQTFEIIVYMVVGINSYEYTNSLVEKVYPVPASGKISFYLNLKSNGKIQIMDLAGKMMKQVDVEAGQKILPVDISDLASTVYLFRVIESNSVQVGKFIKE